MPELPEVETIKRELVKAVLGRKITEVCVHNPAVIRQPSTEKFKKGLSGAGIKNILRKAKVLILELSNGKSLVIHLKMTGQLIYPGDGKKSRVSFKLSDGKMLDFNDQRLFAELRLLDDWHNLKFIQGLGPEPFDLMVDRFKEMLAAKKTKIKPLLMDQTFISGVGNLDAAEVLFRAKIHPERPAQGLLHPLNRLPDGAQRPVSNCPATANIISATARSSRRQVRGRASQGASQAAPRARAKNQSSEALAAPMA